jgi:hypothetical protein
MELPEVITGIRFRDSTMPQFCNKETLPAPMTCLFVYSAGGGIRAALAFLKITFN